MCEWFLMCANEAAGTVTHPILGEVPTCERCADKAGKTLNVPPTYPIDDECTVTVVTGDDGNSEYGCTCGASGYIPGLPGQETAEMWHDSLG